MRFAKFLRSSVRFSAISIANKFTNYRANTAVAFLIFVKNARLMQVLFH